MAKRALLKATAPTKPVIATHKLKIDIPTESPKSSTKGVKLVERRKSSLTKKNSPGEYLQTIGEAYRHDGGSSP